MFTCLEAVLWGYPHLCCQDTSSPIQNTKRESVADAGCRRKHKAPLNRHESAEAARSSRNISRSSMENYSPQSHDERRSAVWCKDSETGTLDTSATDNNNRDQGEHATQLGPENWHLHPSSPISNQSYTIVFSLKETGLFIIFIVRLSTHLPSTYPPHHPLKTLC